MLLVVGIALWLTWRTAVDASNAAYDRSLLGAIKSIDANITTDSGGLAVELPYRMLEFFELTASGQVYYHVATEDGLAEIGNADLPAPALPLQTGRPQFGDAAYFGEAVRVGSYARMLAHPLAGQQAPQRVIIQVAEPLRSRAQFRRTLVLQALARDLVLVLVAGGLLVLAIGWALRPLARLRQEVGGRSPQDLTPIATGGIPADVRPLVEAINHHVERTRRLSEARRRFVDDASHQLRTPLATLTTQVGFALRESDPAALRDALRALKVQLDETVRQTNQMLALARTDSAELVTEPIALDGLAAELARAWWAEARSRQIDLGLEVPDQPVSVQVHPGLLKEALSNLLHNAIRYTPAGGQVTVRVAAAGREARLMVIDNGPGIPEAERARASERFFRASNASQPGSGLGLAIVRSIAERHGGRLELDAGPQGQGLVVAVVLPLAAGGLRSPG
ncbi:MAG: sensor histidine kinase N-terminal domain-containing protein [Burkholderiaceae bacterium]|nr:sensor histidine kinase N-terminal domain-containing protein [Burkholderiaceae bacterium]